MYLQLRKNDINEYFCFQWDEETYSRRWLFARAIHLTTVVVDATLGEILCTYIVCLLPTDNLTTIFYVIFTFWRNLYFLICRETLDHLMRLCLRKYPCGLQYFWNREENAEYCLPIGWMSVICCSQLRLQVVFFSSTKRGIKGAK